MQTFGAGVQPVTVQLLQIIRHTWNAIRGFVRTHSGHGLDLACSV